MAKRKFRIVKRENNIPVLGVCEHCTAEFTADPATICRPQDGHALIQKQFVAHKCKRSNVGQNALRIVREGTEVALSTSRIASESPDTSSPLDPDSPQYDVIKPFGHRLQIAARPATLLGNGNITFAKIGKKNATNSEELVAKRS